MNWDNIVEKVSPHVVKIETPSGSGTGFFFFTYAQPQKWCAVATALHVISDAYQWQQPIKIHGHRFERPPLFLAEPHRAIFIKWQTDSAVILFQPGDLQFPEAPIPLRPVNAPISIGAELGWLGFPSLEPWTLCFFSGNVSARPEHRSAYLIDGVAISGVSGGPVVFRDDTEGVQFVGIVSAYQAARTRGESLPGLLVAQDVTHFHEMISTFNSWEEAKRKQAEEQAQLEQARAQSQITPPPAVAPQPVPKS
jgi:hypothetical protein